MEDIKNIDDVKVFVNSFYDKIQEDTLLAPIFGIRVEGDGWQKHLDRMYEFWGTVLLFEKTYRGRPFAQHIGLPISEEHFNRWLHLFNETIDAHFKGDRADEVKWRAGKMATMFQIKMNYFNGNSKPIL